MSRGLRVPRGIRFRVMPSERRDRRYPRRRASLRTRRSRRRRRRGDPGCSGSDPSWRSLQTPVVPWRTRDREADRGWPDLPSARFPRCGDVACALTRRRHVEERESSTTRSLVSACAEKGTFGRHPQPGQSRLAERPAIRAIPAAGRVADNTPRRTRAGPTPRFTTASGP